MKTFLFEEIIDATHAVFIFLKTLPALFEMMGFDALFRR
jgi:hypothetical protein